MTGRAVLVAAAVALIAPAAAAAHPDWRAPSVVGVAQEGVFRFPQALAYDASGTPDPDPQAPAGPYVYVADQHSFWVQKFTADGRFVRRFGGYGSEPGHFGATSASASPTTGTVGGIGGLAVDDRGRVYVLDSFNSRVERFSPGGEFQSQFGTFGSAPGRAEPGHQRRPRAARRRALRGRPEQRPRAALPSRCRRAPGRPAGRLRRARHGARDSSTSCPASSVDPARDHDVFVADDRNHRIQRFDCGRRVRGPGRARWAAARGSCATRTTPGSTWPGGCSWPTTRITASCASTPPTSRSARASAARACSLGSSTTSAASPWPRARSRGRRVRDQHVAQPGLGVRRRRRVRAALGRRRARAGRVHAAARRGGRAQRRHRRRRHARRPRAGPARETGASTRGRGSASRSASPRAAVAGASSATRPGWPSTRATATSGSSRAAGTACSGSRRAASSRASRPTVAPTRARRPGASPSRSGSRSAPDGTVWVADTRNNRLQWLRPAHAGVVACWPASCARPRSRCSPTDGSRSPSSARTRRKIPTARSARAG